MRGGVGWAGGGVSARKPAGGAVSGCAGFYLQRGHFTHTAFVFFLGVQRAAGMKRAAAGRIAGAGHFAGQNHAAGTFFFYRIGFGHGGEQRDGVGMLGVLIQILGIGDFHDPPQVHHRHAVGKMLHHCEVVRDKQITELQFALQVLKEIENLRLDRDIERGDRLIADDELGLKGECPGDADALPLAAGEFMRIAVGGGRGQPDAVEQFGDAFSRPAAIDDFVHQHRFGKHAADGHARVEAADGILENDLHVAAQGAERGGMERENILAFKFHRPLHDDAALGFDQPQNRTTDGGFSAAGFADKAERFTRADLETDILDGFDVAGDAAHHTAMDGKVCAQVAHIQQRKRNIARRRRLLIRGLNGHGCHFRYGQNRMIGV